MDVAPKRKRSLGGESIESGYSRNEGKIIRNSASEIKKPIVVKNYHSQAPTIRNGTNSERTDLVTEISGNYTSGKKLSLSKRAPSLATATYRGLTVLPDITPVTSKFNLTHLYKQTKTPKNTNIVKKSTELSRSDRSDQDTGYQIKSEFIYLSFNRFWIIVFKLLKQFKIPTHKGVILEYETASMIDQIKREAQFYKQKQKERGNFDLWLNEKLF